MDCLARREYSRKELFDKLRPRSEDLTELEAVLDALIDDGLQSDERFADNWFRSRLGRGWGPMKMRQEARIKGVSDAQFERLLNEYQPNWFDLASDVLERRFGSEPAPDAKEKARRIRFLQGRGFGGDVVFQLVE